MTCSSCREALIKKQTRCYNCGMSLVGRDDLNGDGKTEGKLPDYIRTPAQQRRTNLIVSILIGLFSISIASVVIIVLAFRLFPSSVIQLNHKDVSILAVGFDIVDMDKDYLESCGTNKKVNISYTVVNNSKKVIKKLDAKIYAKSNQLQIWSSKGVDNVFHFVNPSKPLNAGDARSVIAEFPILYNNYGIAEIAWNYDIVVLE